MTRPKVVGVKDGERKERTVKPDENAPSVKSDMESLFDDVWIEEADAETDGGPDVAVVDHTDDTEAASPAEAADLPERSVGDDPLTWIPEEFQDEIDGSIAINRKGFEVLSHFYDVDVHAELQVPPEETDHEYCRVKATATIDGRECQAFGSASTDRGDDAELLLEMADTRARKRAISIATGVGAVAVEELKEGQHHA